jgi:hypothetical protein
MPALTGSGREKLSKLSAGVEDGAPASAGAVDVITFTLRHARRYGGVSSDGAS